MNFRGKTAVLLIFIIIIGIFFRTYKLEHFYIFDHDQDLFSWIVKDITVDHHHRIIGQLTSIDGVFIGSLFYYLLTPFFLLSNMNPVSANIPVLLISIITTISIFHIFSKLFNRATGIIGAIIYSVSIGNAFNDRWIVPTQPTVLWCAWYLFALFMLLKGNLKILPLIAILFALIWHIHIALIVLVFLVPISIFISNKKINLSDILLPMLLFIFLSSPFFVFELRHNFQQIKGLVVSASEERGELKGIYRLEKIFEESSRAFSLPIYNNPKVDPKLCYFAFFAITTFLLANKILAKKRALIIFLWIAIVIISQYISKRPISSYYFSSFNIITILIYSLFLGSIYGKYHKKQLTATILVGYFLFNLINLIKMPEYPNSYFQKKKVVEYITHDALEKGFPCIGINYIADYGQGVGFRYLFWLNKVRLINPNENIPVYNIVIPFQRAQNDKTFGMFGVITPKNISSQNSLVCEDPKNQLLPLLGFTK